MACKSAKAKSTIYYLSDGAGLRMRIRPDGSRTWIYRYRLDGKEMSTGLGAYPTVSLQIARAKALEARLEVSKGNNPSTSKRIAKTKQITKGGNTFGLIANEWLEHNKPDWSGTHYERNEGLLRRFLLPDLAKLPIESISEAYLYSVIKKIYDRGTKVSAARTRTIASQVFSYARATHRATSNPARDMSDNPYFKKPPVKHFEALPKEQVPLLMAALNKESKEQQLDIKTVCALKLALYTGLRDNSIRGAKWPEIDLERKIWTVPASRMKSGNEFKLPLPTQAVEVFKILEPITFRELESYIFPSTGADFSEKFEELIENYNAGSRTIEALYQELLELSNSLNDEEHRHIRENMTEEELVIFDILTRPSPVLGTEERAEVKKIARELLERLKSLLVLNWRQKSTARSQLKLTIEDALDMGLPHAYTPELYQQKCSAVFEHVFESYPERNSGIYS